MTDSPSPLASSIFTACDIRGIDDQTLIEAAVSAIGTAILLKAHDNCAGSIVVGRDGRQLGPRLVAVLTSGITAVGVDVISTTKAAR